MSAHHSLNSNNDSNSYAPLLSLPECVSGPRVLSEVLLCPPGIRGLPSLPSLSHSPPGGLPSPRLDLQHGGLHSHEQVNRKREPRERSLLLPCGEWRVLWSWGAWFRAASPRKPFLTTPPPPLHMSSMLPTSAA